MFCNKCGSRLSDGEKYCKNCGEKVNDTPTNSQTSGIHTPKPQNQNTWQTPAAIALGAVSLIFTLLYQPLAILLAMFGIFLSCINLKENKQSKIGLILSIIGLTIAMLVPTIRAIYHPQ